MMDEHLIVGETIDYFRAEHGRLERELTAKEEEYKRLPTSFSELSVVSFWEKPYKPLLKWFIPRKANKLRQEIPVLTEKVKLFSQAIADLEQGIYNTAIPLFHELTDRFLYPLLSPVLSIEPMHSTSMPNPTFLHILNLKKQLISLHEAQV